MIYSKKHESIVLQRCQVNGNKFLCQSKDNFAHSVNITESLVCDPSLFLHWLCYNKYEYFPTGSAFQEWSTNSKS